MNYVIKEMNDSIAEEISNWHYEGEYKVYNTVSFKEMKSKNPELVNTEISKNHLCFFDKESGELIAYVSMKKKENENIYIGIGLKPIYCGKGLGAEIMHCAIKEVKSRYINNKIMLMVRSWNIRAIKCYIKAGFKVQKTEMILDFNGNETEFIYMEYLD
ncbi:MAG: GNAT family N-acetyltransferase [Clostridia bacterium]|nr:GNAT family N-acetyltransferase [Clostridia bacterium]